MPNDLTVFFIFLMRLNATLMSNGFSFSTCTVADDAAACEFCVPTFIFIFNGILDLRGPRVR